MNNLILFYSDFDGRKGEPVFNPHIFSVFLAGPSPRNGQGHDWRKELLKLLQNIQIPIQVFIPLPKYSVTPLTYMGQVDWEDEHLEACDLLVFWVPRDLQDLPGFTTNVEFGEWIRQTKKPMFYGRPNNAPKTRYLDYRYKKWRKASPINSLESLATRISLAGGIKFLIKEIGS